MASNADIGIKSLSALVGDLSFRASDMRYAIRLNMFNISAYADIAGRHTLKYVSALSVRAAIFIISTWRLYGMILALIDDRRAHHLKVNHGRCRKRRRHQRLYRGTSVHRAAQ